MSPELKQEAPAQEKVVISRFDPFLNADKRIYAAGSFCTTNIRHAQRFNRDDAEKMLNLGRWHGLDPKIEEAPDGVREQASR